MSITQQKEIAEILSKKYKESKMRNEKYSIRSFAKKLNINSGALTEIMSSKRRISEKLAIDLCSSLDLTQKEKEVFMRPFARAHALIDGINYFETNENLNWYHFAVLSLIKTSHFKTSPDFISKALKISPEYADSLMQDLLRLKIVNWNNEGRLYRTKENIKTCDNKSSDHLKELHKTNISKALDSLSLPVEQRDLTSIMMPVNIAHLDEAKKMIRKFQDDISILLECGEKTQVYNLCVQLYPISEVINEN